MQMLFRTTIIVYSEYVTLYFFVPVMLPAVFVMFVTCYKIRHQVVCSSTNLYWLLHVIILHSIGFNIVTILYFRQL